ncbi:hypothetical protein BH20GEM1_BH20GEM1_17050 [soil metagenome]
MPELPSYRIRRAGDGAARDAGALYDLPRHAQVCLHTDDPELVLLLEAAGMVPPRPPYLDAAGIGIHGAYRSRPQINVFLEPPVQDVAEAFARAFADAGGVYAIEPVTPALHAIEPAGPEA